MMYNLPPLLLQPADFWILTWLLQTGYTIPLTNKHLQFTLKQAQRAQQCHVLDYTVICDTSRSSNTLFANVLFLKLNPFLCFLKITV